MKVVFIVDVPGWSLDIFAKRLGPHLDLYSTIHYLHLGLDHLHEPPDLNLPSADVYYCTSWWFLWLLIEANRLNPKASYVIDVVDAYSWRQPFFALARRAASLVFTLSLDYLQRDPLAVSHPFPTAPAQFTKGCTTQYGWKTRKDTGRLKVGMITYKGALHSGNDHKGELPWCDLEVAGIDHLYSQEEMPAWYQTKDVFLTLSTTEGFSAALVDALTAGLPIIGTPVSPLHPYLVSPYQYLQTTREPADVRQALTDVHETLTQGGVLPTAFDVALQWDAARVGPFIGTVLRGLRRP